jgi:hypothetical protein
MLEHLLCFIGRITIENFNSTNKTGLCCPNLISTVNVFLTRMLIAL